MRQHVTPTQLQELTVEQRERLREWWVPQVFDVMVDISKDKFEKLFARIDGENDNCWDSYGKRCGRLAYETLIYTHWASSRFINNPRRYVLPLLSVGQMIELLESKTPDFDIHKLDAPGGMIPDRNYKVVLRGSYNNLVFDADSLVDALWQAVKEVL